ncbi:MAG: methionyl-tRNA formyltransferase [Clostridia bacterium]|nr:methionyl-tRNA formyltransferase [Clostridia bacterium]
MRIVFLGTPDFAVSILSKLVEAHEVVAVVSQPDRAKNRKGELINTPTKEFALNNGISVFQFEKIRNHPQELRELNADIFVTAAYGQILSQEIIDIAPYGIINVHASLLPKYRGSSPIQTAILNGDEYSGVSIMQTEMGMDSGAVLGVKKIKIDGKNCGELSNALAELGAELLLEVLEKIATKTVVAVKQDESKVVSCKKISKDDAAIDWMKSADEIYNCIRAFNPNPIAYTSYNEQRFKIYEAQIAHFDGECGEILFADKNNGIIVACGDKAVKITKIQAPGKKAMSATEFLNGNKITVGEYFGK